MSLIPARMKKIQSKMKALEWPQHFPHYTYGDFSYAQGQLTLQYVIRSGKISNSFESLWLSSLPARMKKIGSKTKTLEWPQYFSNYNPMGAICCHRNQSSDPYWPKT